jgi:hypothetical protein
LEKRGMSLRLDILNDENRKLEESIGKDHRSHAPVARKLSSVLDKLDAMMDEHQPS